MRGVMTEEQRAALMKGVDLEQQRTNIRHRFAPVEIHIHLSDVASIDCRRCRRSLIALQDGRMVGSASSAGCA